MENIINVLIEKTKNMEHRKNHKFDLFDKCTKCGVIKKKIPFTGDGYNIKFKNKFTTLYSKDNGVTFQKEFINCTINNYIS